MSKNDPIGTMDNSLIEELLHAGSSLVFAPADTGLRVKLARSQGGVSVQVSDCTWPSYVQTYPTVNEAANAMPWPLADFSLVPPSTSEQQGSDQAGPLLTKLEVLALLLALPTEAKARLLDYKRWERVVKALETRAGEINYRLEFPHTAFQSGASEDQYENGTIEVDEEDEDEDDTGEMDEEDEMLALSFNGPVSEQENSQAALRQDLKKIKDKLKRAQKERDNAEVAVAVNAYRMDVLKLIVQGEFYSSH